jgi:NADPH-dependent 2,4-dienoyl-CoA reductase/sulfur reductase-like enzyme
VIVGASLAGRYGAEALRAAGFDGRITLIGEEPHAPYDRPPLSKSVLAGRFGTDRIQLPVSRDPEATWLLGTRAAGIDRARRVVRLADGRTVGYDKLLIATGARARGWHEPEAAALRGVHVLRTREDADRLRSQLLVGPRRVLVVGAGFTGCEIASSCRESDLPVTLAGRGRAPLEHALGGLIGEVLGRRMRVGGVDLRLGTRVCSLRRDSSGWVRRAVLADGAELDVDLAVIALGARANTEWLAGAGFQISAGALVCDASCRVLDAAGRVVDGVYAAGDVTCWRHPLFDAEARPAQHWGNAVAQARLAGRNMLAAPDEQLPCLELPAFWTDQFGLNIKAVGMPEAAEYCVMTQVAPDESSCVAAYGSGGRLVGAVAVNAPRVLDGYAAMIRQKAPFPPEINAPDAPSNAHVVSNLHVRTESPALP